MVEVKSTAMHTDSFKGLRRQFLNRFVVSCLLVGLVGGYALYEAYNAYVKHLRISRLSTTEDYVTRQLGSMQHAWEEATTGLMAQIDYMHLLRGGSAERWGRLTSYLRVRESGVDVSDSVLIFRKDGKRVFAFGPARAQFSELSDISAQHGWLVSLDKRHVYRLSSHSLWLGDEGQGTAYVLYPVENSALDHLASADVDVAPCEWGGCSQLQGWGNLG